MMTQAEVEASPVKMWLFPWLSYATQAGILAVLIAMAFVPGLASQLYTTLTFVLFLLLAWFALRRRSPYARQLTGP
jgi:L-asparagine transporter-like permease